MTTPATGRNARELDFEVTAADQWSEPILIEKGQSIATSIKGAFSGTIKVRRWLPHYEKDAYLTPQTVLDHIGLANEFTDPFEGSDISGGTYFYQIGTDEPITGTAYCSLQ